MKNANNAPTQLTPQNSNRGFTLLELMIVITIVGIMFSFLALSIRSNSPEEVIETEARRLNQLIRVALEEAILRGEEYAIVFKPNSYQFAHLSDKDTWEIVQNDRQLRTRELPQDMSIELDVDNTRFSFTSNKTSDEKTAVKPQVFLLSSGEITPEFTVNMLSFGISTSYRIEGKANGQHSVSNNND